jgi:hypothetical protein
VHAQQLIDDDAEELREGRQHRHGEPDACHFIVGISLLRDLQHIGDGLLAQARVLAQLRDARAELFEEQLLVGGHEGHQEMRYFQEDEHIECPQIGS